MGNKLQTTGNKFRSRSKRIGNDHIDFALFRRFKINEQCHGDCDSLSRIIQTVDFQQFLVNAPKDMDSDNDIDAVAIITAFCEQSYPKRPLLNDYIHFMEHHSDPKSI